MDDAYNRAKEVAKLYCVAVKGAQDGGVYHPEVNRQIALKVAFELVDNNNKLED